ncbi:MAG: hypothetical protein Greene07144_61 [Parcubacteria group bacterium Greene0714_4]|nr:MAG: hypothetical protein Greene07144_61 [Parcubacteria group bacterium Greene0714_4]
MHAQNAEEKYSLGKFASASPPSQWSSSIALSVSTKKHANMFGRQSRSKYLSWKVKNSTLGKNFPSVFSHSILIVIVFQREKDQAQVYHLPASNLPDTPSLHAHTQISQPVVCAEVLVHCGRYCSSGVRSRAESPSGQ